MNIFLTCNPKAEITNSYVYMNFMKMELITHNVIIPAKHA